MVTKSIYCVVIGGYPIMARTDEALLGAIQAHCIIPGLSQITRLLGDTLFSYGAGELAGVMPDGTLKIIGTLYHRERIPGD